MYAQIESKLEKLAPKIGVNWVSHDVQDHVLSSFLGVATEDRLRQQLVPLNVLTSLPRWNGLEDVLQPRLRLEDMKRAERQAEHRQVMKLPRQELFPAAVHTEP